MVISKYRKVIILIKEVLSKEYSLLNKYKFIKRLVMFIKEKLNRIFLV